MQTQARVNRSTTRTRGRSREANGASGWRLGVVIAGVALAALGLGFRLALFQIVDHAALAGKAGDLTLSAPAQPVRGTIFDDTGNVMAMSDEVYNVQAAPREILDPGPEAKRLAPVLHESRGSLLHLLRSNLINQILATRVSQSTADSVTLLGLPGISLAPLPNRVYPQGTLASHILGFVNSSGGQYGLEEQYNQLLAGKASPRRFVDGARAERDRIVRGTAFVSPANPDSGATLRLSVDTFIQEVVERTLRKQVKATGASSGTIIVTNPRTGRVIALANYPWFNPNSYSKSKLWALSDAAIDNTYEPGSTFKIVTMAAGLNTHVIRPSTTLVDRGYILYPRCSTIPIHNWNYPIANGLETMTQVLQHSANVGASYVGNLLGSYRFYKYVRRFGVGSVTGVDLAGEASGYVPLPHAPNSNWTCVNLYDNSFGQSLTTTPLQLLTAVNAVANHGIMMRPSVVNRIEYEGVKVYRTPHRMRRVISRGAARTLTSMLVQSAMGPPGSYGEAACALVPGYQVAAKTGTASLVDSQTGKYKMGPGSTIASTVGYAPAFRPRFSVLVVIRKPRIGYPNSQWGSVTAAPLVHDILMSLFLHYHVPPRTANTGRILDSQRAFGGCSF